MRYLAKTLSVADVSDTLIVGLFSDGTFTPAAKALDDLSDAYLTQLLEEKSLTGKKGEVVLLQRIPQCNAKRVIVVGCGDAGELTVRDYKKMYTSITETLNKTPAVEVVSFLNEVALKDRHLAWQLRFAVESIENTNYHYDAFKTRDKAPESKLASVIFHVDAEQLTFAQQMIDTGLSVAQGVRATKDLANCPPNICTPEYLAEKAQALANENTKISVEIIGEDQMRELGMNAYLAVSQGSTHEAKMSIMHYHNASADQAPIVLVGKGLTFDAGGISLKPGAGMDEMKYDMGGAAAVYGIMTALAKLDLPLNVIGVMAGCENLPDGEAYRPGDILKTMNGLTVEVLNTDAEGRLVLCDTLTYVERFKPALVVDMATLTGACVIALGAPNTGLMTEDETLAADLLAAANESQDKAWRLPIGEDYAEMLKSPFADLANIGGRAAGASTAGAFLANFTESYRWAHLDIAGTAWNSGENKGATGRPVGLMTQFLINQATK